MIDLEVPSMRWPPARRVLRWSVVAIAVLVAAGIIMRVVGLNVRLGQPPEFGWTAYPMLAVAHWAEPADRSRRGSCLPGSFGQSCWVCS
jgi:hypothetical protein